MPCPLKVTRMACPLEVTRTACPLEVRSFRDGVDTREVRSPFGVPLGRGAYCSYHPMALEEVPLERSVC